MERVLLLGEMGGSIRDSGVMGNRMERAYSGHRMARYMIWSMRMGSCQRKRRGCQVL